MYHYIHVDQLPVGRPYTEGTRTNGTVLDENPFVYVDFFSVVGEWGVAIEHQDITVETTQADVGDLSIYLRRYNIIVGQSQTC